jgi:hypothetical protein
MNEDVSRRIRQLCANPTPQNERKLRRALILQAGRSLGVQEAKTTFDAVIKRSLNGKPQVICTASNAVVLISVADLARLLIVEDDLTIADTLEGVGCQPAGAGRRMVEELRNQEMLKRHTFPGSSKSEG